MYYIILTCTLQNCEIIYVTKFLIELQIQTRI